MNIKRIYNKNHDDLYKFRISAIEECGGNARHIMMSTPYPNIVKVLNEYGANRIEDIYRFTEGKWNSTEFDHIDCHYADDGKITSISGALQYGQWMRGGIYHFALKEYTKKYPSRLFWKQGHLERLHSYALEKGLNGVFISIYPHNRRLQALCKKLKDGSGIPTPTSNYKLIRALKYRGSHVFNGVPQEFFVLEGNSVKFNISSILE